MSELWVRSVGRVFLLCYFGANSGAAGCDPGDWMTVLDRALL